MPACETCAAPCKNRFCSKPCKGAAMRNSIPRLCDVCGTPYRARRRTFEIGMGRTCSKSCSNTLRRRPMAKRFYDFYKPLPDADACWPWTGSLDRDGYGVITDDQRKQLRSHRIAYELAHGPVEPGRHVMHTCDNPPCCNPKHLRAGSCDENNKDKTSKERQARGETIGKLTTEQVVEIRQRRARGERRLSLARDFSVSIQNIDAVIARRTWKHVP